MTRATSAGRVVEGLASMLERRLRFAITNPSFNDSHLFVTLTQQARTVLFDCGPLIVPKAVAHEIRDVCLSHRHMDHLMGFATFARQVTATREPIRVVGPKGTARALSGLLQAFEWNYRHELKLRLEVTEVLDAQTVLRANVAVRDGFRVSGTQERPRHSVVHRDAAFELQAFDLDHHTAPCLGYCLALPDEWRVDPDALRSAGLHPGPWIGSLLKRLQRGETIAPDEPVPSEAQVAQRAAQGEVGTAAPADALNQQSRPLLAQVAASVVRHERGMRVGFVTDTRDTPAVRERLREHLSGADVLFAEAYFSKADSERAAKNGHLTGHQIGEIATELNVGQLVITHISPRYPPSRVLREVREVFPQVRSKREFLLGAAELEEELDTTDSAEHE